MFREALLLLRRSKGEGARSLQVRLFAFFVLFAVMLVGLAFLALMLTGVFNTSEQRHSTWLNTEIGHLASDVSEDYSKLSLRCVALADALSSDIHTWARDSGITEKEIASHPELIESLLAEQADDLLSALHNNACSGAFMILDATVNPDVENAAYSKSGVFFKRTETNSITPVHSKTVCLRGPASVARANGAELMGQWRMEFDISGMGFYQKVLDTTREKDGVGLSRLYYWSSRYLMDGNSEHVMLLCVPLVAQDGTVYGMCGMEVSAMLFKHLYCPDNTEHPRVFAAIAPKDNDNLDTDSGLVAGNSYLTSKTTGRLTAQGSSQEGMAFRRSDTGDGYVGRMKTLQLYPTDSPYESEQWALALLIPASDWDSVIRQDNFLFYGSVLSLLAISLLAAVFISRRYIRPVVSALELIKSDNRANLPKTQIAEINDLMEYLSAQDEQHKTLGDEKESLAAELERMKQRAADRDSSAPRAAYEQFLNNLKTLTATEEAVFKLYMKKRTAQQISDELFITKNTVKFHNKNIYAKLGVSSLKELMVYVNMMNGLQ